MEDANGLDQNGTLKRTVLIETRNSHLLNHILTECRVMTLVEITENGASCEDVHTRSVN